MSHAQGKRNNLEAAEAMLECAPPQGYTIYDVADRLGLDPSTVHRYLKEIERERALIEIERGHYRLDPAQSLSNVRLHPAEALSIYLALRRFIRQTSHAPSFMLTALEKVAPAVREPQLFQTLAAAIRLLQEERLLSPKDSAIWETIIRGWREQIVVRMDYLRASDDSLQIYEIEPLHFEPATLSQGTYMIAWSRQKGDLRTFKMDRIRQASLTTQRFDKRPEIDANALLRHAWGIWYGDETERVELRFSAQVSQRVLETIWHPEEKKRQLEDGTVYWEVRIASTLEIKSWVRGWGPDVVVLAPESLRQAVAADMRAAAALYEEGEG